MPWTFIMIKVACGAPAQTTEIHKSQSQTAKKRIVLNLRHSLFSGVHGTQGRVVEAAFDGVLHIVKDDR
jgi:hypothetical protein